MKKEFDKELKFYTESMQTESSVKYWSDKAERHKKIRNISGVVFCAGISILSALAFYYGQEFFDVPVQPIVDHSSNSSSLDFLLQRIVVLIIPTFLIVWFLRITVRLFLTNSALADDAEERVTMVKTFRALLEHEEKMDPQDRILMLQALFRPAANASDDDGAPPNWFDVLVNRVNRP